MTIVMIVSMAAELVTTRRAYVRLARSTQSLGFMNTVVSSDTLAVRWCGVPITLDIDGTSVPFPASHKVTVRVFDEPAVIAVSLLHPTLATLPL